jgi:hypothetical protein
LDKNLILWYYIWWSYWLVNTCQIVASLAGELVFGDRKAMSSRTASFTLALQFVCDSQDVAIPLTSERFG